MVKQARNLKEKYILVEGRLCRDVYERPLRTQELSLEWECQTPVSLPSPGGGHGICSTLNGMLSTNEWMHLGYKHLPSLSSPLTASRALSEALDPQTCTSESQRLQEWHRTLMRLPGNMFWRMSLCRQSLLKHKQRWTSSGSGGPLHQNMPGLNHGTEERESWTCGFTALLSL